MSICEHCKSRHSWECDDGCAYPKHGCGSFELDWNSLTYKQKKAIIVILEFSETSYYFDEVTE